MILFTIHVILFLCNYFLGRHLIRFDEVFTLKRKLQLIGASLIPIFNIITLIIWLVVYFDEVYEASDDSIWNKPQDW